MVTAVVLIGASISVIQLRSSLAIMDADRAIDLVSGQLRYAKQIAVDQRRNVLVEFLNGTEVRITRQDGGVDATVMAEVTLPDGFSFSMPDGISDTPDAYGNQDASGDPAPVFFNFNTSGTFQPDGSFVAGGTVATSGTVFTMGANSGSARAVTMTGASGRTKVYWLRSTTWVERN